MPPTMAVVTAHPQASQAAMHILVAGGSAADAAIAAMAALGVVHPVSSGLGGGGVVLYWQAKAKRATVVDFRATAAMALDAKMHGKRPRGRERGALVGVPGQAAGWAKLHQLGGKLPFSRSLQPAILLASTGFRPSPHLVRSIAFNRNWLVHSRLAKPLRLAPGHKEASDKMKNPALAQTLRELATHGPMHFYRGQYAKDVVTTARAAGGELELSDLASYRAVLRKPLSMTWHGHQIVTTPPPSGGGLMVLQLLAMHSPDELRALRYQSGAYLHRLASSFRGSIADRLRAIGDPAFEGKDVARLLRPERLRKRKAGFADNKTQSTASYGLDEHGTSQVLVRDAEGNVAAATCSVGSMFGAALIARGGFALNDAIGNFNHERIERRFGSRTRPNKPRKGARPAHSWTPTLVLKGDRLRFAYGAAGGMHIPTAVAQVLLATLLFDRSPIQAIHDLRLRLEYGGTLLLPSSTPKALRHDLRRRGEVHRVDIPNYSAVQIIELAPDPGQGLRATGDARKGNAVQLR